MIILIKTPRRAYRAEPRDCPRSGGVTCAKAPSRARGHGLLEAECSAGVKGDKKNTDKKTLEKTMVKKTLSRKGKKYF